MIKLSSFVKNVAVLVTGSMVANVIAVATIPLISRLFTPEDFGSSALFLSIVTVLSVISALRYEHAILLPDDEEEARDLTLIALVILVVATGLTSLFVIMFFFLAPALSWNNTLGIWLLATPVGVLILSMSNVVAILNTRLKRYREIANSMAGQAGMMSGSRIFFGIAAGSSAGALIIGLLLGEGLRYYLLGRGLEQRHWLQYRRLSRERVGVLLRRYQQFPKYSLPTGLLRSLGRNIPVFFLAYMFSPLVVGLYAMSNRLVRTPVTLIGESVRRPYLQKAAVLHNRGVTLTDSLAKTTVGLSLAGLLIFLPLMIWGREIFSFVLGEQWEEAGTYMAILVPWIFCIFIQSTPSVTYIVCQRQDILFKIHAGSILSMLMACAIADSISATPTQTLAALSGVGTITNLLIVGLGFRLARSVVAHS